MSFLHAVWLVLALLLGETTILAAQSDYHYSYLPKNLYNHQVFSVTVVGPDTHPILTFDTASPLQPLFKKPLLVKNGQDTFYTFYFKAKSPTLFVPMLFIESDTERSSLPEQQIGVENLQSDTLFSAILATDIKIKSQQVSNYDARNHMVTLSIEAYEANLEDMVLHGIKEYGIENLTRSDAKVTAEFYAVLPREKKVLTFSYYNTIKKRFITLTIPVEVANASVTTQSDLNPKVDVFESLKRYTFILFSLFFIVMFLWKRDFFYLILGVVSLITLLTFYIPHKKICIRQGAPLYILPSSTSTIGTRIDNRLESLLLGEHGEYKKIEYKKGVIGWIKNEDICND